MDALARQQYNAGVGREMGSAKPRPASGQVKMVTMLTLREYDTDRLPGGMERH
jgi:hypothetical protein